MAKIVIGIDPDSKAHGVATYVDGRISTLENLTLVEIMIKILKAQRLESNVIEFHIEDVCANNAIFRGGNGIKVQQSIARRLGMVQQSQAELERLAVHLDVKIVKHKISKMWKRDKAQFEKVTGWSGRSNEDTRSAAYFGWLGTK